MTILEYEVLRKQILLSFVKYDCSDHLFNSLKETYRDKINSPRRFEQINSIYKLLTALETRNELSENNVNVLKEIAKVLPHNEEALNSISEYKIRFASRNYNHIHKYTKEPTAFQPNDTFQNNNPISLSLHKRKDRINKTLIEEIGCFWRDLARNLGIREGLIQKIDNDNKTLDSKAANMLQIYNDKIVDIQKWFFCLCDALEKSNRKDLSRTLKEIMTMNM